MKNINILYKHLLHVKLKKLFNVYGREIKSFDRYLVEQDFDINEKDDGDTPLFDVCYSGNEDIVKY